MSTPRWRSGQRRCWTLLQLSGVGLLLAAAATLGFGAGAGAVPASGDILPDAAQCAETCTTGIPFDSGQTINVVVPANSAFAAPDNNSGVNIVECAAPNGVVPTLPSACDGNTLQNGALVNADGSLTFNGFTVYSLPNTYSLGESSTAAIDCGPTAATECILYIGNNQNDFTQPHLWSQPFFVNPDPTDSGTVDPGDGSGGVVATTASATLSTAVAAPPTAVADGVDSSTITVTLLGGSGSGVPVSGKAVSLTASSSTAKISGPSAAETGANGQTTFTVTDSVAEDVTLTAVDTTDSVTLAQQPSVTFQTPTVDGATSTVSASPSTVPSGGSTTITVTLRDQGASSQPVAGQSVTLAGTGSAVVAPTTAQTTNSSGVVTFTATDSNAEVVTFTATDTTTNTVITNKATVTFGTLTVSASQSTVVAAQSTAAVGSSGGTSVEVTLLTSTSSPVAGKAVSLTSTGSAVVGTPSSAETDAKGQVSFSLTDQNAETVTLTAIDTTDSVQLSTQPTVTFSAGTPSASTSTVTAPATTAPADGETQTEIAVTVKDNFGVGLAGKVITLQGAPDTSVQIHPFSASSTPPGTTNTNGEADFEVDDTIAETVTFTATDTTDSNLVLTQTVAITFTAGAADPVAEASTVTASPANPPADGTTPSTVTATLTDYFGNPIPGKTVSLAALNGSSHITPSSAVTNQAGQAAFTVTDATAEVVTYQATDVTDANQVFAAEAEVKFGNPPIPPAVAAFCSVSVNPNTVPANGSSTATISVLLYDGNADPLPGKSVTLSVSGGTSKVASTNATTNNSGIATFTVSDTTAESVKYTANDTSDSVNLTALPVTITFTAAAASSTTSTSSSSSTTTTTTTSASSGTTASTTATTTAGSVASGASSTGSTGNTGTAGSTGSAGSLAATGSPVLLPWLIGFGALFVGVGAIGRRRFNRRGNEG